MNINTITAEDLRRMPDKEGLILQGCGGDLTEWVDGNRIVVDEKMQTTVPGLYAAGDCTGGLLQVAKAVYEGAQAGTEAAKALRKG